MKTEADFLASINMSKEEYESKYLPLDPNHDYSNVRYWGTIHFVEGQTVREFSEQMSSWVVKGFGDSTIDWHVLGGLLKTGDCRLPIEYTENIDEDCNVCKLSDDRERK